MLTKYPRTRRLDRGQTVVEFAFSVIAFLMLLFGMIGFGIAVYDYNFVSDAAREGTRYASVHGKDSLSPLTTTECVVDGQDFHPQPGQRDQPEPAHRDRESNSGWQQYRPRGL